MGWNPLVFQVLCLPWTCPCVHTVVLLLFSFDYCRVVELTTGDSILHNLKPCGRCVVTTVDPDRGVFSEDGQPLKTLKTTRFCHLAHCTSCHLLSSSSSPHCHVPFPPPPQSWNADLCVIPDPPGITRQWDQPLVSTWCTRKLAQCFAWVWMSLCWPRRRSP